MRNWVESVYLITQIAYDGASDGEDGIIAVNLSRPCGPEHGELPPMLLANAKQRLLTSAITVGRRAVVRGLKAEQYNGQEVQVVGRLPNGRVCVTFSDTGKKVRFTNLSPVHFRCVQFPCIYFVHTSSYMARTH